ncbi:MAG: metal-dependent transcriptional regulator [Segetibacter sp.]|jgi:DtxR family Mn-dependent transcriptional regulator|nr:metal-dependent transcriptional regulator [Segetibacter sp.]
MLSFTEENYLKALLHLTIETGDKEEAGTNEIAAHLNVKPATANDMLKKLKEKKLIDYEKYGKSSLTTSGRKLAIEVVRKHRLWETFLYEKLEFTWDEVHEVAEQLEHIQSSKLVDKLDKFLNYPVFDPHGDAIPTAKGEMKVPLKKTLNEQEIGRSCMMIGVKENSSSFLQYVDKVGLSINKKIKVLSKQPYDELIEIEVNGKRFSVSPKFAENILIVSEDVEPMNTKRKN